MKILIAIGVQRQAEAGAASVVLNHARELERKGHTVDCWFLDDVLPESTGPKRFEGLVFAFAIIKRISRERERYDVVNLHAPWGCVYGVRRRLGRVASAPPYVLTMQGSEERFVTMMRREDRKGLASNFGWKNRLWHRVYHQMMYDVSIRTADYGAVANREAWICAELKHGREPGRIRFVPNGVEEQFFGARDYTDKSGLKLLYVGTWLDRKGVHYLAEAFRIVAGESSKTLLTVAGCGQAEELVKASFAPDVRDRVRVLPFVGRGDMPFIYAEHDIFVFPSLVEGMPLTLLEAMASAMPVVTTNTSGMADVVEDGYNGLLATPADSASLARSVSRLLGASSLRRELGQEAQRTARRYTWQRVTTQLEEILMLAVSEARRK